MNVVLRSCGSNQIRFVRNFSSLVHVRKTETEGVVIVNLNHPPVNSLNLETVKCLTKEIETLNKDEKCRGIILTSNLPTAFSAGVQLTEFHKPNPEKLRIFWGAFQDMWFQLYSSRLPIVAAVNNHAIAGGCLLAVVCDRRVMVKGTIGLNESKLGLTLPIWLFDRFVDLVGKKEGEFGTQCGILYSANDALKLGLVDKLATEEDLIKTAKAELNEFLAVPSFAYADTKLTCRRSRINKFIKHYDKNLEDFTIMVQSDKVQGEIDKYLRNLKSKK